MRHRPVALFVRSVTLLAVAGLLWDLMDGGSESEMRYGVPVSDTVAM